MATYTLEFSAQDVFKTYGPELKKQGFTYRLDPGNSTYTFWPMVVAYKAINETEAVIALFNFYDGGEHMTDVVSIEMAEKLYNTPCAEGEAASKLYEDFSERDLSRATDYENDEADKLLAKTAELY